MAAEAWKVYDIGRTGVQNTTIKLGTDTFKMALMTDSYTPDLASDVTFSSLSGEVAAAYGYTAGGYTVTIVVEDIGSNTVRVDCADAAWSASGGTISALYAVVYSVTAGTNNLLCYSKLNSTGTMVSATDGNTFQVTISASGLYTVTGGT